VQVREKDKLLEGDQNYFNALIKLLIKFHKCGGSESFNQIMAVKPPKVIKKPPKENEDLDFEFCKEDSGLLGRVSLPLD